MGTGLKLYQEEIKILKAVVDETAFTGLGQLLQRKSTNVSISHPFVTGEEGNISQR